MALKAIHPPDGSPFKLVRSRDLSALRDVA